MAMPFISGRSAIHHSFECGLADYFVYERQFASHWWWDIERVERILAHGSIYSIEEQRQPLPVIEQLLDRDVRIGGQRNDVAWK